MQLICEGHHRIEADEHLQLVLNTPVMRDEPVLVGSTAADGSECSIYGTVRYDGGTVLKAASPLTATTSALPCASLLYSRSE